MNSFDTIDQGGNDALFTNEHREAFREGAKFMKIFAIIMFVVMGLALLFMLIFFATGPTTILDAIAKNGDADVALGLQILWPQISIFIYLMPVFLIAVVFGCTKLYKSSSALAATAFTSDVNDFRTAISNMRLYWMITGIMTIVGIVFGVFFVVRVMSFLSELQGL